MLSCLIRTSFLARTVATLVLATVLVLPIAMADDANSDEQQPVNFAADVAVAPPTNVTVQNISGTLVVSWAASVSPRVDGYIVYYKPSTETLYTTYEVEYAPDLALSRTITVSGDAWYDVIVRAFSRGILRQSRANCETCEVQHIFVSSRPLNPTIIALGAILDGVFTTILADVPFIFSADGATEMYIDGDVDATRPYLGPSVRQWIPYATSLLVPIAGTGDRQVTVRYRGSSLVETEPVVFTFTRDFDESPVVSSGGGGGGGSSTIIPTSSSVAITETGAESETSMTASITAPTAVLLPVPVGYVVQPSDPARVTAPVASAVDAAVVVWPDMSESVLKYSAIEKAFIVRTTEATTQPVTVTLDLRTTLGIEVIDSRLIEIGRINDLGLWSADSSATFVGTTTTLTAADNTALIVRIVDADIAQDDDLTTVYTKPAYVDNGAFFSTPRSIVDPATGAMFTIDPQTVASDEVDGTPYRGILYPPTALDADRLADLLGLPVDGAVFVGSAHGGIIFDKPVLLTLPVATGVTDPKLYRYHPETDELVMVEDAKTGVFGGVYDSENNTLSAWVTHFSVYAVRGSHGLSAGTLDAPRSLLSASFLDFGDAVAAMRIPTRRQDIHTNTAENAWFRIEIGGQDITLIIVAVGLIALVTRFAPRRLRRLAREKSA